MDGFSKMRACGASSEEPPHLGQMTAKPKDVASLIVSGEFSGQIDGITRHFAVAISSKHSLCSFSPSQLIEGDNEASF